MSYFLSNYEQKLDRAVQELVKAEIWKTDELPLEMRLYEKVGLKPRPLHFVSIPESVFRLAILVAPVWALFVFLFTWYFGVFYLPNFALGTLKFGLGWASIMTLLIRYQRRKHKLSCWDDL